MSSSSCCKAAIILFISRMSVAVSSGHPCVFVVLTTLVFALAAWLACGFFGKAPLLVAATSFAGVGDFCVPLAAVSGVRRGLLRDGELPDIFQKRILKLAAECELKMFEISFSFYRLAAERRFAVNTNKILLLFSGLILRKKEYN